MVCSDEAATILDKMLEHGSQDRATLPLPPYNVGLENPNEISCRKQHCKGKGAERVVGVSTTFVNK